MAFFLKPTSPPFMHLYKPLPLPPTLPSCNSIIFLSFSLSFKEEENLGGWGREIDIYLYNMGQGGNGFLLTLAMVAVQVGYAGLNVLSKLALDTGMSPFVLISYRQIVATLVLTPFAYFFERKSVVKINSRILLQILFSSTFGVTLNQLLYFIGLKYSTPTVASALSNILPAMTFLMALPFRIETAEMRSSSGQAKVAGTALCVGGSMLMTFYKGALINVPPSGIRWRYAEEAVERGAAASAGGKEALGALLIVASCLAWAAWFIMQARMSESFSAPYTTSALLSAMAAVECVLAGFFAERDFNRWAVGWDIRLAATLYIGVVCSGLALLLTTWAIEKRGPLFVSMFSPLLLMIVAVLGWAILNEKLYVGSVLGSVIIVIGLYLVLWGKGREFKMEAAGEKDMEAVEGGEGEDDQKIKGVLAIFSPTFNAEAKDKKLDKIQVSEVICNK